MSYAPSRTRLVMPHSLGAVRDGWDTDGSHVAQNHTIHTAYEPLTSPRIALDADGVRRPVASDVLPRLAERWEGSADARSWTVRLREGVISHHGRALTAEDVRWSWERAYALRRVGRWRSRRMAGVAEASDVRVLDDRTLRFDLRRPNPEFPQYLIFSTNQVFDSTEARAHATPDDPWATGWLSRHPAGFGAFALESQQDDLIEMRGREEYWAGRPGIESLLQVGVETREQALRMVERRDANLLVGLYPEELARFEGRPGFSIHRVRANHSTLQFDFTAPPFDDRLLRQAVCYALPYRLILERVYHGYARQSRSPVTSVSGHHAPDLWNYETDLARARELVAASAYPDGVETELYIDPTYESLRFAELALPALAAIGVRAEARLLRWPDPIAAIGGRPPMWFLHDCGHALTEARYDLGHDYDPPMGIHGGLVLRDGDLARRIGEVAASEPERQGSGYRELQRTILDLAYSAHVAEHETGWVVRGEIDPWALSEDCLVVKTTVWSTHRNLLNSW
ncbi:MAG: ABC transporter substrate-binding protein [Chloroflexi bacterium]|nr:ABC transporter substrate-binding protein [Chloroflexota bacterium]